MDKEQFELVTKCSGDKFYDALKTFVKSHSNTFDLSSFEQSGQWSCIWNAIFNVLTKLTYSEKTETLFPICLTAIKILTRSKIYLNETVTVEQFDCLLNIANIGLHNLNASTNIIVESLKALCNLIYQSTKCSELCSKNSAVEGIIKRLKIYKDKNFDYHLQFFDMKLLFLITALNSDLRTRVRDDWHGLTYLIETLDVIMIENKSKNGLSDNSVDLSCEILKVLFNLTVRNDLMQINVSTEEEEEIQFRRIAVVVHDLLLCKAASKQKEQELCSHTINLLTNLPTGCYSELVTAQHDPDITDVTQNFEGSNMIAISILLDFLKYRLDNIQKLTVQQELLSPILTSLVKCVRCNSLQRRYVRLIILPPLHDFQNRPEVGDEIRNQLCRLLTTPAMQVRDLTAELLFVICKENVARMIKYTGFGNAAGLLANRGLLGNRTSTNLEYSSESEDSDTEEYKLVQHNINPVIGCYEESHPNPFEGMSEEQKEYEAMKLVTLMDQLKKQGVVQPCRIGPDGRPEPIEHILELQEDLPQHQIDVKRKT